MLQVRELQRVTGARVEVPRENQEGAQNGDVNKEGGDQPGSDKMINVKLHGHFFANQVSCKTMTNLVLENYAYVA